MNFRYGNVCKHIDWTEISHGDRLMKFVARAEASDLDDYPCSPGVEIHGFVDESGTFYITNEILLEPEKKGPSDEQT